MATSSLTVRRQLILCRLRGPLTLMTEAGLDDEIWNVDPELTEPGAIRRCLIAMRAQGLLEAEREGPQTWWSSTPAGREALDSFESEAAAQADIRRPYGLRLGVSGLWRLTHPMERIGTPFLTPADAGDWLALERMRRSRPTTRRSGSLAETLNRRG